MKKIFLMLLMGFLFAGCEKDDICTDTTPTTPRLVIEFYDNDEATPTLKNVTNLDVIDPSFTEGPEFTGVSKIQIPLRTEATTTVLRFIQNGSDSITTNDNVDVLTFYYTTENIYVSRACGYKTLFNLNPTNAFVQTEPTVADGAWIKNITIVKYNLENENEIHVKIKF
jgi:hypothetical protein